MITIELSPPAQHAVTAHRHRRRACCRDRLADLPRPAPPGRTVTAICCPACRRWRPPRHCRRTSAVCRDCH